MSWFSKAEATGKDRIQGVVQAFKTQLDELEKGVEEVDTEVAINDQQVVDAKAEALRVEMVATEDNRVLLAEKVLANGLRASIEKILDPAQV